MGLIIDIRKTGRRNSLSFFWMGLDALRAMFTNLVSSVLLVFRVGLTASPREVCFLSSSHLSTHS